MTAELLKMSSRRGSIKLEMHDEGDACNKGLLNQFMKSDSDFSRVSQQEELEQQKSFHVRCDLSKRGKRKRRRRHIKCLMRLACFFHKRYYPRGSFKKKECIEIANARFF